MQIHLICKQIVVKHTVLKSLIVNISCFIFKGSAKNNDGTDEPTVWLNYWYKKAEIWMLNNYIDTIISKWLVFNNLITYIG